MSNAIAFADFGKDSSDLLLKGFPTSGFKVIAETRTPNSIAIKTTVGGPEKLSLAVEPSYTWAPHNVSVKANFSTTGAVDGSVAVAHLGTNGTKFEVSDKLDAKGKFTKAVTGSFVNEFVNAKVTGTWPTGEATAVNVELVGQFPEKVYWGVNGKYAFKLDSAVDVNARLQMVAPDNSYTIGVLLDHKTDSWDLSWLWSQQITAAVKYSWSFITNSKAGTTPACIVGAEYKVDAVSTVRGRLSVAKPEESTEPNFRVALALNQNLSDHTVVTIGADVNASTILGLKGGADHSIGFEVKLK